MGRHTMPDLFNQQLDLFDMIEGPMTSAAWFIAQRGEGGVAEYRLRGHEDRIAIAHNPAWHRHYRITGPAAQAHILDAHIDNLDDAKACAEAQLGLTSGADLMYYLQPRREVVVGGRTFNLTPNEADPIEAEVRGIRCILTHCGNTYAVDGPGSLFWSETGFRSFCVGMMGEGGDFDAGRRAIEAHIDGKPGKDGTGGLGGKLVKWWPGWVLRWQQDVDWDLSMDRATTWTQWGPERHAEIWAEHDERRESALARMWAEGIDPNEVGKPRHFKGQWPDFKQPNLI